MKRTYLPGIRSRSVELAPILNNERYRPIFDSPLPEETEAIFKLLQNHRLQPPTRKFLPDKQVAQAYIKAFDRIPPRPQNLDLPKFNNRRTRIRVFKNIVQKPISQPILSRQEILGPCKQQFLDDQSEEQQLKDPTFRNQKMLEQYPHYFAYLKKKLINEAPTRPVLRGDDQGHQIYLDMCPLQSKAGLVTQRFVEKTYQHSYLRCKQNDDQLSSIESNSLDQDLRQRRQSIVEQSQKLPLAERRRLVLKVNRIMQSMQTGRQLAKSRV